MDWFILLFATKTPMHSPQGKRIVEAFYSIFRYLDKYDVIFRQK